MYTPSEFSHVIILALNNTNNNGVLEILTKYILFASEWCFLKNAEGFLGNKKKICICFIHNYFCLKDCSVKDIITWQPI